MQATTPLPATRRRFRLRGAYKLAVILFGLGAVVYSAWHFGVEGWVDSHNFTPLAPGPVTIIGIKPDATFRVIVADRMAKLVLGGKGKFDYDPNSASNDDSSQLDYVPVREMLGSLRGNTKDLSDFVTYVNKLGKDKDWPGVEVVWKAEDIQKALAGDPTLKAKLIHDLNVNLDGSPLPQLNVTAAEDGIVIDIPVPVKVEVEGVDKTLIARIRRPYKADLLQRVYRDYDEKPVINNTVRAGWYVSEVRNMEAGKFPKENIAKALQAQISSATSQPWADFASSILTGCETVINSDQIKSASCREDDIGPRRYWDLSINLDREGQLRLWKYAIDHPDAQLMVISDGVAIAAPKVSKSPFTILSSQVTISQLPDQTLAEDAANFINGKKSN